MKRLGVALAVTSATVLAAPTGAYAIDHVVLSLAPAKVAQSGPLKAWTLGGSTVDASFDPLTSSRELFGLTLERSFLNGRGEERHAFRASPTDSLQFDGARGRWQARLGNAVRLRMTIAATGMARPVDELLGCRGAFARVQVVLRGSFALATQTRTFKTIRRTRLAGTITYNTGGHVACSLDATAQACTPTTSFSAAAGTAQLLASRDLGGWLSLAFADGRPTGADAGVWYHVMLLTHFDPFAGDLPALTVGTPAQAAIRGSGAFTAGTTTTARRGPCTETTTTGRFDATFRARFTGWGARTLTTHGAATYSESR